MNVLVDTSVWIRFLSNRAPYAADLDRVLSRDEASGHELVYGGLLIGDNGGRAELLESYQRMDQAQVIPHSDVVAFVRSRKLNGRGLSWIDAHLLAPAVVGQLKLWTADAALASAAMELGICYVVAPQKRHGSRD